MPPTQNHRKLWRQYRRYRCSVGTLGIALDPSRMGLKPDVFYEMAEPFEQAFDAMDELEAGAIANVDENRMVGHYWLRDASLAPNKEITDEIEQTKTNILDFARKIHDKQITPLRTRRFSDVLLIGIGGSALGPQLVSQALGTKRDKMNLHFLDNTDPDGIQDKLEALRNRLKSTLTVVVSKSGTTPETRNGMVETRAAYEAQDLPFAQHAVAVTGEGSHLQKLAKKEGWLATFPMWDWVGGRTSVTSAVGLVPMALQGLNVDAFLEGARQMDAYTRARRRIIKNPAALLALCWHHATGGRGGSGGRDMVILPYKDRLLLLSRYLQQLVMESLGKQRDLSGKKVNQGIAVYGNKGSTDQHAYVQQLRDGVNNFFVNFVIVRQDVPRPATVEPLIVDPKGAPTAGSGDFLNGFWLGTRRALYENGRPSLTIILDKLTPKTLGGLIALYERAVGYYATLVNINAYHQPGVEAGKKAAADVLDLQARAINHLKAHPQDRFAADDLAEALNAPNDAETLYHVMEHLTANKRYIQCVRRKYQYRP